MLLVNRCLLDSKIRGFYKTFSFLSQSLFFTNEEVYVGKTSKNMLYSIETQHYDTSDVHAIVWEMI